MIHRQRHKSNSKLNSYSDASNRRKHHQSKFYPIILADNSSILPIIKNKNKSNINPEEIHYLISLCPWQVGWLLSFTSAFSKGEEFQASFLDQSTYSLLCWHFACLSNEVCNSHYCAGKSYKFKYSLFSSLRYPTESKCFPSLHSPLNKVPKTS